MSYRFILTLQISGFIASLALLFFPAHHGWFVLSFGVHVVGDVLLLIKEGAVSIDVKKIEKSFLANVKLLPWSQFAATWFAVLSLFVFALGGYHGFLPGTARLGALAGTIVAFVAFLVATFKGQKAPRLARLLEFGGLTVAALLAYFLSKGAVIPCFVGLAVSQAGQWYDSIYP